MPAFIATRLLTQLPPERAFRILLRHDTHFSRIARSGVSYFLGAFNLISHEFVRSRSALIFRGTGIRHARSWDGKGGGGVRTGLAQRVDLWNVICRDPRKNCMYAGFQRSAHSAYRYREKNPPFIITLVIFFFRGKAAALLLARAGIVLPCLRGGVCFFPFFPFCCCGYSGYEHPYTRELIRVLSNYM